MTDLVYYYANHDRKYLALAYQSILSLRRYNRSLPIVLFTEASAIQSVRQHFQFENFSAKVLKTNNRNISMNKFLCLGAIREMGASRVLLLDVDTVFHDDAATLFSAGEGVNLAAREQVGTNPDDPDFDLDLAKLAAIRAVKQSRPCPIFNLGVGILDTRGIDMAYHGTMDILRLIAEFAQNRAAFPAPALDLIEKISVSLYFGTLPDFRYRLLPPAQAPFFSEISTGKSREPGIVIHYSTHFASLKFPNPYADFEGSLPYSLPGGKL